MLSWHLIHLCETLWFFKIVCFPPSPYISHVLIWQGVYFLTTASSLFCTNCVVVITQYTVQIIFTTNEYVDRERTLKFDDKEMKKKTFCEKNSPQARFFYKAKCKTYQTKSAAGQMFGLNPDGYLVLLMSYVVNLSHLTVQNRICSMNELTNWLIELIRGETSQKVISFNKLWAALECMSNTGQNFLVGHTWWRVVRLHWHFFHWFLPELPRAEPMVYAEAE